MDQRPEQFLSRERTKAVIRFVLEHVAKEKRAVADLRQLAEETRARLPRRDRVVVRKMLLELEWTEALVSFVGALAGGFRLSSCRLTRSQCKGVPALVGIADKGALRVSWLLLAAQASVASPKEMVGLRRAARKIEAMWRRAYGERPIAA